MRRLIAGMLVALVASASSSFAAELLGAYRYVAGQGGGWGGSSIYDQ